MRSIPVSNSTYASILRTLGNGPGDAPSGNLPREVEFDGGMCGFRSTGSRSAVGLARRGCICGTWIDNEVLMFKIPGEFRRCGKGRKMAGPIRKAALQSHGLRFLQAAACFAAVFAINERVLACNVPVFRFALERWASDRYEIVVFHTDAVTESDSKHIERLIALCEDAEAVNLDARLVNVDQPLDSEMRELWSGQAEEVRGESAWTVVRGPRMGEAPAIVWSGPLEEFQSEQIVDSPARRDLIARLLAGDSVVWLILTEEGDPAGDEAIRLLEEEASRLGDFLRLPEGVGEPGSEVYSNVPLALKFSVLPIDVADEEESGFVDSIRRIAEISDDEGPVVVPVFGRGRALDVIPASVVDAGLVEDCARFLCGACSCQVKEQNPGVDLLLAVNWEQALFDDGEIPPPPDFVESEGLALPVMVAIPSGQGEAPTAEESATEPFLVETMESEVPLVTTMPDAASSPQADLGAGGVSVTRSLAIALVVVGLIVLVGSSPGSAARKRTRNLS